MAFLLAVYIVVFVFNDFIYCSRIPLILTARDSLTTEATKLLDIVAPVYNRDATPEEAISTQMPPFSFEFNSNPTDRAHFPTEIPSLNEMTTPAIGTENKTTETFLSKFGQRLPKFFGRLALLAGLRLADETSNGAASSINISNTRDSPNPLSVNLTPTRLSPYFAAVYEPFPYFPQSYIYSNFLGLVPLLNAINPQKIPTDDKFSGTGNFPNSQQISSIDGAEASHDFHQNFIPENRKNENVTVEERIIEKVTLEKKQRNSVRDKMRESTTAEPLEEEDDEDFEENTDDEENFDSEESSEEEFVPTSKAPALRVTKPNKSLKQRRPATTKRPVMKKPVTMSSIMETTTMGKDNNATNFDNTTQLPLQNNTGYPFHHGYYGGYPQNVHDLYLTSSEHPPLHENYNEIHPHPYSDEWSSNRIPHESHYYNNHYQPIYDILPHGVEESINDHHSFRGSPVLEQPSTRDLVNSGFRPNFPF